MSVAGVYDCVTKTPMGDQKSAFTVVVDGTSFTGTNVGPMGSVEIEEGQVDGNKLTWTMKITVPMPMTLKGEAVVDGDTITGTVKAGVFPASPMTGTRRA